MIRFETVDVMLPELDYDLVREWKHHIDGLKTYHINLSFFSDNIH